MRALLSASSMEQPVGRGVGGGWGEKEHLLALELEFDLSPGSALVGKLFFLSGVQRPYLQQQ